MNETAVENKVKINAYIVGDGLLRSTIVKICEKAYADKLRTIVLCKSAEDVTQIDNILWTATRGFLPHGTAKSSFVEEQPIYITNSLENVPGKCDCLITLNVHNEQVVDFALKSALIIAHIIEDVANSDIVNLQAMYLSKNVQLVTWGRQNESWVRM